MTTYRITADHRQWIVQRVRPGPATRGGKPRMDPLTFHPTLAKARESLAERGLRDLWPEDGVDLRDIPATVAAISAAVAAILEKATEGLE